MNNLLTRGFLVTLVLAIGHPMAWSFDYTSSPPVSSDAFRLLDHPSPAQNAAAEQPEQLPSTTISPELMPGLPENIDLSAPTKIGMTAVSSSMVSGPNTMANPTWAGPNRADAARPIESVYTRVDYFHWNERLNGVDFDNEDGPLWTLGYERRHEESLLRTELFGSQVAYHADIDFGHGDIQPMSSVTNYLGVRGEYEVLFQPETWPELNLFAGLGTRLWVRDLPNAFTLDGGFVLGYQETWWTIYPYIGLESKPDRQAEIEWYGRSRIGLSALTLESVDVTPAVILYPRSGMTGQAEGGLRGQRLFAGAFFEFLGWSQSGVKRYTLQPDSKMLTVGLKTGVHF